MIGLTVSSKNLDEAARIFAVGVATHGGLIKGDFATASMDQLLKFFPHDRNQRFGYIPAVVVITPRVDAAAQTYMAPAHLAFNGMRAGAIYI